MNFIEVLTALKKGDKVKRPYTEAIYADSWSGLLYQDFNKTPRVLPMLRINDFEAEDWEVVE